ncbi:SMI1/KNR4 family protein [Chishuiella changwenlii]|uniref:SMI1/KNR4 family protein n=1 Tax=Chishuiella changwenlii TaxID=1434701 RepID=UPI002FD8E2A4
MEYLNKIVEKLQKNRVKLIGLSDKEISELEKTIKTPLPKVYLEFLESMGNYTDAKNISPNLYDYTGFGGESIFYDDVYSDYTNKDGLIDQLKEDDKEELLKQIDDNTFVFFSSQGYIFCLF